MDLPFVSEEFQRAFRNTFQAQVNTGRDLHVSDVVIPVVDFTPTTSGTSLPFDLLSSLNLNTTVFSFTTSTNTTILSTTGFFKIDVDFKTVGGGSVQFYFLDASSTATFVKTLSAGPDQSTSDSFFVFMRPDYTMECLRSMTGTSTASLNITQVADVNGSLIQPSGYNPQ